MGGIWALYLQGNAIVLYKAMFSLGSPGHPQEWHDDMVFRSKGRKNKGRQSKKHKGQAFQPTESRVQKRMWKNTVYLTEAPRKLPLTQVLQQQQNRLRTRHTTTQGCHDINKTSNGSSFQLSLHPGA